MGSKLGKLEVQACKVFRLYHSIDLEESGESSAGCGCWQGPSFRNVTFWPDLRMNYHKNFTAGSRINSLALILLELSFYPSSRICPMRTGLDATWASICSLIIARDKVDRPKISPLYPPSPFKNSGNKVGIEGPLVMGKDALTSVYDASFVSPT